MSDIWPVLDEPKLYFAYGSNLNIKKMLRRCPTAVPERRHILQNWKLVFRDVADIEPEFGKYAEGALYWVMPKDIVSLDRSEGVHHGMYRRVDYLLDNEETIFFYVMNDIRVLPPGASYYSVIENGFADWGIDPLPLQTALTEAYAAYPA